MYDHELREYVSNELRMLGNKLPGIPPKDALIAAIVEKMCGSESLDKSHVKDFIDNWLNTNFKFPAVCDIHAWMKTIGINSKRRVCDLGMCKGDGWVFDDDMAYSCDCPIGNIVMNRHKIGRKIKRKQRGPA